MFSPIYGRMDVKGSLKAGDIVVGLGSICRQGALEGDVLLFSSKGVGRRYGPCLIVSVSGSIPDDDFSPFRDFS